MEKRFSTSEMRVGLKQLTKKSLITLLVELFKMSPRKTKLKMWRILKRKLSTRLTRTKRKSVSRKKPMRKTKSSKMSVSNKRKKGKLTGKAKKDFLRRINKGRRKAGLPTIKSR